MLDRFDQALFRLLLKQDTGRGWTGDDCLHGTATSKGDYRCPTGLSFNGDNAKVLLSRKQQRLAAAHVIANHFVRLPTQELDMVGRKLTQPSLVLTASDHNQMSFQSFAGSNRHVDALVRGERRHDR